MYVYILFVREGFSLVFPTHSLWIYKEILVNWLLSSLKWDRILHIQRIVFILLTSCYECGFVIRFFLYLWEDLFPFARVKLFPYPGNSLWHLNKRNLRTIGDERVRMDDSPGHPTSINMPLNERPDSTTKSLLNHNNKKDEKYFCQRKYLTFCHSSLNDSIRNMMNTQFKNTFRWKYSINCPFNILY